MLITAADEISEYRFHATGQHEHDGDIVPGYLEELDQGEVVIHDGESASYPEPPQQSLELERGTKNRNNSKSGLASLNLILPDLARFGNCCKFECGAVQKCANLEDLTNIAK